MSLTPAGLHPQLCPQCCPSRTGRKTGVARTQRQATACHGGPSPPKRCASPVQPHFHHFACFACTPRTLCSAPSTLRRTPSTLCGTPSTLGSTPSTLSSTPSTLCSTPSTPGEASCMHVRPFSMFLLGELRQLSTGTRGGGGGNRDSSIGRIPLRCTSVRHHHSGGGSDVPTWRCGVLARRTPLRTARRTAHHQDPQPTQRIPSPLGAQPP